MCANRTPKSITFISPLALPILLDPPESGAGGAERQFYLFGKGLSKIGWSVCYITGPSKDEKSPKTSMPVKYASFAFMGGSKWRIPLDLISIFHAMWKANTSIYVIKTPAFLLAPMYIFTFICRRKLVFWAQTEFDAYPQLRPKGRILGFLLNLGIRSADLILAQSKSQVTGFRENFMKDAKLMKSIAGSLSHGGKKIDQERLIDILWVGNSMANKRYEVLMHLAQMLPEYTFAVAMNKADPQRYAQASEASGSIGNIRFLGEVDPVEMESWFSQSKLLVNTSVREGFPNTYLQAWQHGLPVVSICIDPDDLIANLNMGIIFDKGLNGKLTGGAKEHAHNLKPIVKNLLSDNVLYAKMSKNALQYVNDNHSENVLVERLAEILS